MKLDWTVTGTITYKDSSVAAYDAVWLKLTLAEADVALERIVRAEMRKPAVHGLAVSARAHRQAGTALLQKVEWK